MLDKLEGQVQSCQTSARFLKVQCDTLAPPAGHLTYLPILPTCTAKALSTAISSFKTQNIADPSVSFRPS